MRIILFRHGPAGHADPSRWPDDGARPLSARGEEKTLEAAHGLVRLEPGVNRIFTSRLARADRTARILADALDAKIKLEPLDALAPGGSFRRVMEHLALLPSDETVVLVGHEPALGKIAGVLLFGAPQALALKKAGACCVSYEGPPQAGHGRLEWFLPPRALRKLAGKKSKV